MLIDWANIWTYIKRKNELFNALKGTNMMAKTQQKSEILVWSGTREYERSNVTIATVALSDFSTSFAPSPIQTNTWKKAKTFWLQNCQMQQYCYGITLIHALNSQKSKRWKRQLNDLF